ncbi:unnamed protein product, partial [Clonostachys rhizophaga]
PRVAAGMDATARYESSAGDLSSPPSGFSSEAGSPSRQPGLPRNAPVEVNAKNENRGQRQSAPQYEQIQTVPGDGNGPAKRFGLVDGLWVQLTAAGLPRKKPGRKPGAGGKTKTPDGSDQQQPGQPEQAKVRKPRKPRDPNALPVQRKRKIAPADAQSAESAGRSPKVLALGDHHAETPHPSPGLNSKSGPQPPEARYSPSVPKRESFPGSMQNILNAEPPAQASGTSNSMPVRSIGQSYDPIRDGKYDPVRETVVSNNLFPSTSGSPRAQTTQTAHRSPSIASLIEPQAPPLRSPIPSQNGQTPSITMPPKLQANDGASVSGSPSKPAKVVSDLLSTSRSTAQESKKDQQPAPPAAAQPVIKESNFATIANGPVKKLTPKEKTQTGTSTPKTDNLDDITQEGEGRSILDFGRAKPGEEAQAPTIVLNIPIKTGETNKYVNFMRLAEDRYGWDALHPRLAANRDRKARIAAATASLEKIESGRESGDEMSVDLSDVEGSNPENGGTSGIDAQAKPKKKRNFKEDHYDIDDDFVDDSELLWEAQAAASRDGFFVYSGPLVPEVPKSTASQDGPPKRGRGGGRGSRGGRGGASTRGGSGTGRGGGPGSRGGSITRKPRITKSEKAQREREKTERESLARMDNSSASTPKPSFAVSEVGA